MALQLQRLQADREDEVVPAPEEDQLGESWKDNGEQIDAVPEHVMVINQDLDAFERKEFAVFALSQSFNKAMATLVPAVKIAVAKFKRACTFITCF